MTSTKLAIAAGSIFLVAMTAASRGVGAQSRGTATSAPTDVSAALLAEVKALRADIAESSRAGLRAQLLMARLQLQEQRIIHLDRRRAELTVAVAAARDRLAEVTPGVARLEEMVRMERPRDMPDTEWAAQVREFSRELGVLRDAARDAAADEQRVRNEESEVAAALSAEQARWNDFNSRLDDLERAVLQR
jgi:hypothetical protein